jgi:hypothetical protein
MKAGNQRCDKRGPLGAGYMLADAEALTRQWPATFELPALDERLSLSPGDCAKLVFMPSGQRGGAERMWVRVESRRQCGGVTHYRGTLANEPIGDDLGLRLGAPVSFTSRRIIDVARGAGND